MNALSQNEIKKLGVVFVVLLVLLLGFAVLKGGEKKVVETEKKAIIPTITVVPTIEKNYAGVMGIYPEKNKVKVGGIFDLSVTASTSKGNIAGADAIINFSPEYLNIESIEEGELFDLYPLKKIDNEKGIVKVTGFGAQENYQLNQEIDFFSMKLRAKKAGTTQIAINFQKDKTNLSNVVEAGTSRNILGTVYPAEIEILP